MVLLKLRCSPERRKAVIAVTLSTSSPTLSLNAPEDPLNPFQIIIGLRIAESIQPGQAITICTKGTVFQPTEEGVSLDTLALGTISGLVSSTNLEKKISFGHFKLHLARRSDSQSPDLRKRDWLHFITIPAEGQVQITHNLPISRIFRYEDRLSKDDLRSGESYRMRINPGYLGTTWWCWGDLEGNLMDKKLSAWQEGITLDRAEKPKPEEIERDGWILGENNAELTFDDQSNYAEFQFVE